MSVDAGTNRLALHVIHEERNAAFSVHGGWQLPEHYGDVAAPRDPQDDPCTTPGLKATDAPY